MISLKLKSRVRSFLLLIAAVSKKTGVRYPLIRRVQFLVAKYFGLIITGDSRFTHQSYDSDFKSQSLTRGLNHSIHGDVEIFPWVKSIQLVRDKALGDVILVSGFLPFIREKYPNAKITIATSYPDVFINNPFVDFLIDTQVISTSNYDLTYFLDYEMSPEISIYESYARSLGLHNTSVEEFPLPHLHLDDKEIEVANQMIPKGQFWVLHCNSGWKVRDWPFERFMEIRSYLSSLGFKVVILGSTVDQDDFQSNSSSIDLRGKTTIRQLFAIIYKSVGVIGIDSSFLHIASAFRKSAIGLFGCTNPELRLPAYMLQDSLYTDEICRGCHHRQRPLPVTQAPACPYPTIRCMDAITTQSVKDKIDSIVNKKMLVSIIIPQYENAAVTKRCVDSVVLHTFDIKYEIIIVDDGSKNIENAKEVEQLYPPQVNVIYSDRNYGFSHACNTGAKIANGEFVLFLNNDTTVTRNWIHPLLGYFETYANAGSVGPKLLYPENSLIQHCGTVINKDGNGEHIYRLLPQDFIGSKNTRFYKSLTAACLLIRKKVFDQVGGFDEIYRNGGEDTDLCFKLLDLGLRNIYCPASIVFHHEGLTRGIRSLDDKVDIFNRKIIKDRWQKYLSSDESDFFFLSEIESWEKQSWPILEHVPQEIQDKYNHLRSDFSGAKLPYHLELGSGLSPMPNYLHMDIIEDAPSQDFRFDINNNFPFVDGTIGEILANHVIEHVSWRTLPPLVAECFRVLKFGGKMYVRTPNLRFIAQSYLSSVLSSEYPPDEVAIANLYGAMTPGLWANIKLFSGQDYAGNFHNNCMDPDDLKNIFYRQGFSKVELHAFGREFSPGEIQLVATK